jgi:hypothetical protein
MLRAIALALRGLREIFLMTQPPLLAVMQGGEFRSIAVHSHLPLTADGVAIAGSPAVIDGRYS